MITQMAVVAIDQLVLQKTPVNRLVPTRPRLGSWPSRLTAKLVFDARSGEFGRIIHPPLGFFEPKLRFNSRTAEFFLTHGMFGRVSAVAFFRID